MKHFWLKEMTCNRQMGTIHAEFNGNKSKQEMPSEINHNNQFTI